MPVGAWRVASRFASVKKSTRQSAFSNDVEAAAGPCRLWWETLHFERYLLSLFVQNIIFFDAFAPAISTAARLGCTRTAFPVASTSSHSLSLTQKRGDAGEILRTYLDGESHS
jgi:hypothetical protein